MKASPWIKGATLALERVGVYIVYIYTHMHTHGLMPLTAQLPPTHRCFLYSFGFDSVGGILPPSRWTYVLIPSKHVLKTGKLSVWRPL